MITVQLTEEEAASLKSLLEWILSDLRMEIRDTERMAFRDSLKGQKAVLQKVVDQLEKTAE